MHSSNPLTSDHFGFCAEQSPESLHLGGFTFVPRGLDVENLTKTPMIHSVPYYDLGGLSPPKPPRGDGTGSVHSFTLGFDL